MISFPAFAMDVNDIVKGCADCHGKNGVSSESDIPTLAGQSAVLIEDALLAFAEKQRPCANSKFRYGDTTRAETDMCKIAARLSDDQKYQLGEHYSALPFVAAEQIFDETLVDRGAVVHERNCEKCHSEGGSYADDDAGILAGQWTPYLSSSIQLFLSKKRPMAKKMAEKINRLKPEDIEALLNFYASKTKAE